MFAFAPGNSRSSSIVAPHCLSLLFLHIAWPPPQAFHFLVTSVAFCLSCLESLRLPSSSSFFFLSTTTRCRLPPSSRLPWSSALDGGQQLVDPTRFQHLLFFVWPPDLLRVDVLILTCSASSSAFCVFGCFRPCLVSVSQSRVVFARLEPCC